MLLPATFEAHKNGRSVAFSAISGPLLAPAYPRKMLLPSVLYTILTGRISDQAQRIIFLSLRTARGPRLILPHVPHIAV